jgi:hypothetical protein
LRARQVHAVACVGGAKGVADARGQKPHREERSGAILGA